jgi:hypothetical protein
LTEVTATTVPAGTLQTPSRASKLGFSSSGFLSTPFKGGAVNPDAVKDDSELSGNCDLGLFYPDALRKPQPPRLQCAPFLRPVQQDRRSLEQIRS